MQRITNNEQTVSHEQVESDGDTKRDENKEVLPKKNRQLPTFGNLPRFDVDEKSPRTVTYNYRKSGEDSASNGTSADVSDSQYSEKEKQSPTNPLQAKHRFPSWENSSPDARKKIDKNLKNDTRVRHFAKRYLSDGYENVIHGNNVVNNKTRTISI